MNSLQFLEASWQDLRHGARLLRLNPAFTLVAILSLALGIGANTAIFQLLDAVRLRSLPVSNPQELAEIRFKDFTGMCCESNGRTSRLTSPLWERIRGHQQAFSALGAWSTDNFNLSTAGEARITGNGLWVSGEFFQTLGVRPLIGRVFTALDDASGCECAASRHQLITSGSASLPASPSAVGSPLTLNGQRSEVIGVTPAEFFGVEVGRFYDVALPLCAHHREDARLDRAATWWLGGLSGGWNRLDARGRHGPPLRPLAGAAPGYDSIGVQGGHGPHVSFVAVAGCTGRERRLRAAKFLCQLSVAAVVHHRACFTDRLRQPR